MISKFLLCGGCSRHFRRSEAGCPFCGASAADAQARVAARLEPGASRSRRHAAGAALIASGAVFGCSGESTSTGGLQDGGMDTSGSGGAEQSSGGGTSTGGTGGSTASGGNMATGGTNASGGAASGGSSGGGSTCDGATNRVGYTLCRRQSECTGLAMCVMQEPPRGCGNPTFLPQQCIVDTDCPSNGWCQTDACGGHTCVAGCDPEVCTGTSECVDNRCVPKRCDEPGAAPCAEGYECSPGSTAATHPSGCIPIHCTDNADCEDNFDCAASAPGNGCVQRACTNDADCDCGYCVNTRCEATLGFCYELLAMPYGCVWPDEELV